MEAGADSLYVFGVAHQLEPVQIRHLAFTRDDVACKAELFTEIGIPCRDDRGDQRTVVFVVQELDDLPGNEPAGLS
jgi:hypothetical protein